MVCSGAAAGCAWCGPNDPQKLKKHEQTCVYAVTRRQLEPLRQRVADLERQLAAAQSAARGLAPLHPQTQPLRASNGLWRVWDADDVFATVALPDLRLSCGRWSLVAARIGL